MKKQSRSRSCKTPPKKLTAIQTSRHLRVSHRKHSGHVLPRQNTSYPVLFMIVLCVGVLLLSWTRFVSAGPFPGAQQDTYDVNLRVPGPPPTLPATITSPTVNTVFTEQPIYVTGNCPSDTYVSLSRNGVFSGVGICKIDGTFSVKTGLFVGSNTLLAQVYSRTDVAGPPSDPVTVMYSPPVPPPNTPPAQIYGPAATSPKASSSSKQTTSSAVQSGSGPLLFKSMFKYMGVYTGTPTNWELSLDGGTEPYAIHVEWGDGMTSVISRAHAGSFLLQHQYKQAGKYKGSYTANFSASDADGSMAYLQLITIVNDPPVAGAGSTGSINGGFSIDSSPAYIEKILQYVWPGYGIVSLMLLSFWLGERRELQLIRPHHAKNRHRHAQ